MTSPLPQLVLDIQAGLERGEFGLIYQPIMDTSTRRVLGAEALLQWSHPKYGKLLSGNFLDIKPSSSGDIHWKLSVFVVNALCRDIAALPDAGNGPLPYVSFNIDPLYLADPNLAKLLQQCCHKHGVPGSRLIMEVQETECTVQLLCLSDALSEIKGQGVRIAIDDFGTKFSSLTSLTDMEVDIVKLPGKLLHNVPASRRASIVAASIINLLKKLKIEVIAEGIESESQLRWLVQHKVSCAQGLYLSQPVSDLAEAFQLRNK